MRQLTGRSGVAKKMWFGNCRQCGFPRLVSHLLRWNSDGTINAVFRKGYRVVIFPTEFLDGLFTNVEDRLGISIRHLVFEAQSNATKVLFEGTPGARLVSRLNLGKRFTVEFGFNRLASMTGMFRSETLEYVPGSVGIARITNPFQLDLAASIIVGAFEFLEDCPIEYSWEEDSPNSYVITVRPTPEESDVAKRLKMEFSPALPGELNCDRCPRCGVPRALNHLRWVDEEGIILDRRTGTRVMMSYGYMVTAVFREMAKELGEEVNLLLVDAQREWTIRHVGLLGLTTGDEPLGDDELERAYRTYLGDLPAYGQGNPVTLELLDPGVRIEVLNPYQKYIMAGTLQGLFEALEKTGSAVEWEEGRPGAVTYTITPA